MVERMLGICLHNEIFCTENVNIFDIILFIIHLLNPKNSYIKAILKVFQGKGP